MRKFASSFFITRWQCDDSGYRALRSSRRPLLLTPMEVSKAQATDGLQAPFEQIGRVVMNIRAL
jgi:hypothetical protein